MSRNEFTPSTKRAIHAAADGRCERCTSDLGPWEYNHKLACWLGGGSDVGNGELLCKACHRGQTTKDQKAVAKVKRIKGKTRSQWKRTKPGQGKLQGRGFQGWQRMNGKIVWK